MQLVPNIISTSQKKNTKTTPPNRNNDPSNQNTAPPRRPTEMLRKVESLQYVSRWDEQKPEPGGCNLKPQENNIQLTTSHPFLYIPTDIMAQLCYSYSCYFIGFWGGVICLLLTKTKLCQLFCHFYLKKDNLSWLKSQHLWTKWPRDVWPLCSKEFLHQNGHRDFRRAMLRSFTPSIPNLEE